MKIILILRKLSRGMVMFLTWLLLTIPTFAQTSSDSVSSPKAKPNGQSAKQSVPTKPEKPAAVRMTNKQQNSLELFSGKEVFYRPDKTWGFKINLNGFIDLRSRVSGMTIVGFGVHEDSIGMTLAHLYVHGISKEDSITTPQFYADRLFQSIANDSTIVNSVVAQTRRYGLEVLEYDRVEVWQQPDPNNPGQMFDSTLVRHHVNAITTYRDSWIELHLSKTEYKKSDSSMFNDLLNTFEITENFERKRQTLVKPKAVKKP